VIEPFFRIGGTYVKHRTSRFIKGTVRLTLTVVVCAAIAAITYLVIVMWILFFPPPALR
jgi:hypothetical protein